MKVLCRKMVCAALAFLATWLLPPTIARAGEPAKTQPDPSECELTLGEHIEKLSLIGLEGQPAVYRQRGSSMFVAEPGQYRIEEIFFKDGFSVSPRYGEPPLQITLSPGKNRLPDIGGTLAPSVDVKRIGGTLKLGYFLVDASGRKYLHSRVGKPYFTVYQGDRQIGSGTFEYG